MPSDPREPEDPIAPQRDVGALAAPTGLARATRPGAAAGRPPRQKRSVTLDAPLAEAVDQLVEDGAAESFSAAINDAAARWVANQHLGRALDALYADDPGARPTQDAVRAAATRLGLA